MVVAKKKLNVIRPTLRHKKRYVHFSFSKGLSYDAYNLFMLLNNNFQKIFGIFITAKANITVINLDLEKNEITVRVTGSLKNTFGVFFNKNENWIWGPFSWVKAPETLPLASDYSFRDYGLLEPFKVYCTGNTGK